MFKLSLAATLCVVITLVFTDESMAQRGRGGGGARAGGGGGGGGARMASPSMNRSPSMSRPAPQATRPAPQASRPAPQANRPTTAAARPSAGNLSGAGNRPTAGAARPSAGAAASRPSAGQMGTRSPQSYQKPSQKDLGNFLNMPSSQAAAGSGQAKKSGSTARPAAQSETPSGDGSGSRSFTTEGGTTITVGGSSGSGTTAGGVQVGGAVGGIKIETAGGETYGKIGGIAGATDGTNSAVRGGSITGAQDAQGNAAVNVRGGYADSSGYRQGGSVTATRDQYGYTTAAGRAGYGYGDGTGQIGAAAAVRTPYGNVVSAGRGASFVNGQFVGGQSWAAVNGAYTRWNAFGPGYVAGYPNAWWPGKWAVATTAWATATYAMAGSYCGCSSEGAYYDYGENVTYEDGTVYQDGEAVATAEEYYEQADQIAEAGETATNEEWMPLGVFSLIVEGQTQTDKVVQLALNKEGIIRGNYHDLVSDKMIPVSGAVDKETQRVAFRLEGNDSLVVETGLYNLTNDEVPILIHFDANRQEPRVLVRLKNPEEAGEK